MADTQFVIVPELVAYRYRGCTSISYFASMNGFSKMDTAYIDRSVALQSKLELGNPIPTSYDRRATDLLLTDDQKRSRVQTTQQLYKMFPKFIQKQFSDIFTSIVTWVEYFEPIRKVGNKTRQTKHGYTFYRV